MKESDWKKFKIIKERAIERFCNRAFEDFSAIISNSGEPVHDRYLRLYKFVRDRDKEMALIFDEHSRSKAPLQLAVIRANGLVDDSLLAELSDEFREQTDPERFG